MVVVLEKGKANAVIGEESCFRYTEGCWKEDLYDSKTIALATYKGRPYDLRVSVQRGTTGKWQVTGVVGKVAGAGRHVTNVAKGKVRRTEVLLKIIGSTLKG